MSYKLVIFLPNSCFVTRFVVSLCIFCLLIVKNSRVCLNKQITMLSIQQFSHTLSVVQIYQYGYILLRYGESSVFCYSTCDNLKCDLFRMLQIYIGARTCFVFMQCLSFAQCNNIYERVHLQRKNLSFLSHKHLQICNIY